MRLSRACLDAGLISTCGVAGDPLQVLARESRFHDVLVLPGNANLAQRVSLGWQNLPVPVIAVLEGCYGGGMQIALGADVRIASHDCKLSIMEAKWGLVPDMAGLVALRQIMPWGSKPCC